jgi:hypothetical protein
MRMAFNLGWVKYKSFYVPNLFYVGPLQHPLAQQPDAKVVKNALSHTFGILLNFLSCHLNHETFSARVLYF